MSTPAITSPSLRQELGTLSKFPREIRDKIYGLVLNFNKPNYAPPGHPRIRLLQVSHRIHDEAEKALYNINEFRILIVIDPSPHNISVMGAQGFRICVSHRNNIFRNGPRLRMSDPLPSLAMLKHIQSWEFMADFLSREDIMPTFGRSFFGPERPTFKSLSAALEKGCNIIRQSDQVHQLYISLETTENTSSSLEFLLEPVTRLRNIREIYVDAVTVHVDYSLVWRLKASYSEYLAKIVALPQAADTPDYVPDDEDEDEIWEFSKVITGFHQ